MHPEPCSAFVLPIAMACRWVRPEAVSQGAPVRDFGARWPRLLIWSLRGHLAALRRRVTRPSSDPGNPPPRLQGADAHWEDPLLWLLIVH